MAVDRPLVMAILNATPDSFSDGGRLPAGRDLEGHVLRLQEAGADILDVGGESTRPGHVAVAGGEELRRVLPVLEAIRAAGCTLPVSIDTRKADVARAALAAGAHFVNDVGGLADPGMRQAVREAGCSAVVMRHADLGPGDPVDEAVAQLEGLAAACMAGGIPRDRLVLDPGLGFGRPPGGDVQANLRLAVETPARLHAWPVLVGASRKRFLGTVTGEQDPARRVGGSVAVAMLAAQAGAAIVRVHDVAETAQALRVLAASHAAGWPPGRTASGEMVGRSATRQG